MSRSATGKPCTEALPTPLQTLGHLQLWLPPEILCSRCCGNGIHSAAAIYDEQRIHERSKLIGYAISARTERFPEETPYRYEPLADQSLRWNEEARETSPITIYWT